jgi:hypothetical protein
LFVPGNERLWLDVRPPGGDRVVRLLGEVERRAQLGSGMAPTTPAGFAVQLVGGLGDDLEVWAAACRQALEASTRGVPTFVESTPPPVKRAATLNQLIQAGLDDTDDIDDTELQDRDSTVEDVAAPPLTGEPPDVSEEGERRPVAEIPTGALAVEPGVGESPETPRAQASSSGPNDHGEEAPPLEKSKAHAERLSRGVVLAAGLGIVGAAVIGLKLLGSGTAAMPPTSPAPPSTTPRIADRAVARAGPALVAPSPATSPTLAPATTTEVTTQAPPPTPSSPSLEAPGAWRPDLSRLKPGEGYLRVDAGSRLPVSVHGTQAGYTNEWVAVRCGPRFIRLGSPGSWAEAGRMEVLPCSGLLELTRAGPPPSESDALRRIPRKE